jgi:putative tryptophan/tyrosine transport system substrate-binding protein
MAAMSRRAFLASGATFLIAPLAGEAQHQMEKVWRIGLLRTQSRDTPDSAADGLRQGLRELGYIDGHNVVLKYRWAGGRPDRLPTLARELVRAGVDIIVTGGEQATQALVQATGTIPIVMGASNDPVRAGVVASLAQPGGNVTGMTVQAPELSGKRLQLLKDVLPRLSRVAVLSNPAYPGTVLDLAETRSAAQEVGLTMQNIEVRRAEDLNAALAAAREQADALILLGDPFFTAHRERIVDLALKQRLPAMYYWKEFVQAGGLASYGPSLHDLYRRAATHVDKILRGARPADLPVEQPTKFELVINLKTAKALGLTIAPSLLLRADQVIE